MDGLAEEMHRVISNTLDGRVDSSNCKKVCLPLPFLVLVELVWFL